MGQIGLPVDVLAASAMGPESVSHLSAVSNAGGSLKRMPPSTGWVSMSPPRRSYFEFSNARSPLSCSAV